MFIAWSVVDKSHSSTGPSADPVELFYFHIQLIPIDVDDEAVFQQPVFKTLNEFNFFLAHIVFPFCHQDCQQFAVPELQ